MVKSILFQMELSFANSNSFLIFKRLEMQTTLSDSQKLRLLCEEIRLNTFLTLLKSLEQFDKESISKKDLIDIISEYDSRVYRLKQSFGLEN